MSGYRAIERDVAGYYSRKLAQHGATHAGVDWNSEASQRLRFDQLLHVVDLSRRFSIIDYGCGYGALLEHLRALGADCEYVGFDISEAMVAAARERHGDHFTSDVSALREADYVVASGIFNVRAGAAAADWPGYVHHTLRAMTTVSRRGIAFNCLTSYSDAERMEPRLHYADPLALFDFCKRELSRQVALLHDYGLYEFTMLVRLEAGTGR